jgi:hypothetical protein
MWKVIGNRFGAVTIGLLLLVFLFGPGNDVATPCNGRAMGPGDTCVVVRHGAPHTQTYQQRRDLQKETWALLVALSLALTIGGAGAIITRAPARRTVFIQTELR